MEGRVSSFIKIPLDIEIMYPSKRLLAVGQLTVIALEFLLWFINSTALGAISLKHTHKITFSTAQSTWSKIALKHPQDLFHFLQTLRVTKTFLLFFLIDDKLKVKKREKKPTRIILNFKVEPIYIIVVL